MTADPTVPRCYVCQKLRSPQEAAAYRGKCEDCWAGFQPHQRAKLKADRAKPDKVPSGGTR